MWKFELNIYIINLIKGSWMFNIFYFLVNVGLEYYKENLFGGKG